MAVYTQVSDDELVEFMAAYDLGEVLSCKGIAEGIENSNFQLTTSAGNYILTLYEKRVDARDLPFFLGLMEHLSAAGVPCPIPICGRDGENLRPLAGRPAAVISFLPGMWPRRITPEHCAELGSALAHLHLAGMDFPKPRGNSLSVAAWRPLFESIGPEINELKMGLAARLDHVLGELEASWPDRLPTGVIHADLFPDNVFFLGDRLSGVIDFYFACSDILSYDLAICLNAWCFEADLSFNVTKAKRLFDAYGAVRPLAPVEIDALPVLAQGAALRFLLTRLYDWLNTPKDAYVTRKDPMEYDARLRFHRRVESAADYGIDG